MRADRLYRAAWRHVRRLPTPVGYGLFDAGADVAWALHRVRGGRGGVGQLERNLSRILPAGTTPHELHRVSRAGMRSYMRYFYEAFALPGASQDQVAARVRADLDPKVLDDLATGPVVLALGHMGNWDLAGAWACRALGPVLTVAERLDPPDLFDQFVAFREGLGMRIIGQGHGEKVFDQLLAAAHEDHYLIPLLADRDLSAGGVEVDLAGHPARFAAGPAALAQRLGRPLYAASIHYERLEGARRRAAGTPWGVVITIRAVPAPEGLTGREQVVEHTRAWAARFGGMLRDHPVDWHMLQPVFTEDLDLDRLSRRHARERAQEQEDQGTGTASWDSGGTPGPGTAGEVA